MEEKPGGGWKWIAGGLALVLAYQLGYESGSERAASTQPPIAQSSYLSATDDPLMGNAASYEAPPTKADLKTNVPTELTTETTNLTDIESRSTSTDDQLPAPAPEPWRSERTDPVLAAAAEDEGNGGESSTDSIELAPSTQSTTVTPAAALSAYATSKPPAYGCAENGSCYGDISVATGRPKTVSVRGYYRRDGTYVRGHYRSRPR